MKNSVVCSNCKTENPFYKLICESCKSYIRDRVYNIDLGNVLARLIESPTRGFRTIIFAEHKNFITFLIFLAVLKFEIDSVFISLFFKQHALSIGKFIGGYLSLVIIFTLLLLVFSFLVNTINKTLGYATRVKDNFSIFAYSLIPHIFALIVLFPLELVMFGEYLFSANPSPFDLKEFVSYTLLILELLMIAWSLFLTVIANYTQTKNIIYSIVISIIFHSLLFFTLYSFPKII
jgi:hypothetical protein